MLTLALEDAAATEALGASLAQALQAEPGAWLITLDGPLGAGKTTLARGFIRALGHQGRVPSPTYTLVEPYELAGRTILHLDLYRLGDAAELEYLGFRDVFEGDALVLMEWPQRAAGQMPAADIQVRLGLDGTGRKACLSGDTARGETVISELPGVAPEAAKPF